MDIAITFSTLAVVFALCAFHVVSRGAHPFGRVMGYFGAAVLLVSIWQFWFWPEQEPNMTLVVLIGLFAFVAGGGFLYLIFRPGWNRTR